MGSAEPFDITKEILALRKIIIQTARSVKPGAGLDELLKVMDGLGLAISRLSAVIKQQSHLRDGGEETASDFLDRIMPEVLEGLKGGGK